MSKKRLVNWCDSMSLHAENFKQTEDYFLSAIADNSLVYISGNNYGMLPSRTNSELYNGIRVNEHLTGHIEVQLFGCKAITASGFFIDFDSREFGTPLVKRYSPSDDEELKNRLAEHWDIVLSVNPFERTPTGEPKIGETPPRHPDCESKYDLFIMATDNTGIVDFGSNNLTIGRIRRDGERFVVDTNYIPPCVNMSAHPVLLNYFDEFSVLFVNIERACRQIIEKVHIDTNKNSLSLNMQTLCRDILRYIAGIYFDLRNKARISAPIDTVSYISGLAHTFYIGMVFLDNKQKEELLKYFYEWTDITPGAIEELTANTVDLIYRHNDLRGMMIQGEHFLRNFSAIWERMSRLEFLGQHKESLIISEVAQNKDNTNQPTRSWSFID